MCSPGSPAVWKITRSRPPSVFSTWITRSAPAGNGAPVMMRAAVPGRSAKPGGSPAATVPETGRGSAVETAPATA